MESKAGVVNPLDIVLTSFDLLLGILTKDNNELLLGHHKSSDLGFFFSIVAVIKMIMFRDETVQQLLSYWGLKYYWKVERNTK